MQHPCNKTTQLYSNLYESDTNPTQGAQLLARNNTDLVTGLQQGHENYWIIIIITTELTRKLIDF